MFVRKLLVLLGVVSANLAACTCDSRETTCAKLIKAAAVVEGRVVSVAHDWAKRELQYKIRVRRSFKGMEKDRDAKVVVPMDADECGLPWLKQGDLIITALGQNGEHTKDTFHLNSCGFFYIKGTMSRVDKQLLKRMQEKGGRLPGCGCLTAAGLLVPNGWTGMGAFYQKTCTCTEGNYQCENPALAKKCTTSPATCGPVPPCSKSNCKVPGPKTCVDDYCNGCKARWYTEFNVEITAACEALN